MPAATSFKPAPVAKRSSRRRSALAIAAVGFGLALTGVRNLIAQTPRTTRLGVAAGPVIYGFPSGGSEAGGGHARLTLGIRYPDEPVALQLEAAYYLLPEGRRCPGGGGDVVPRCETVPPDLWAVRAGLAWGLAWKRSELFVALGGGAYTPIVPDDALGTRFGAAAGLGVAFTVGSVRLLAQSEYVLLVAQRSGKLLVPLSLGISF